MNVSIPSSQPETKRTGDSELYLQVIQRFPRSFSTGPGPFFFSEQPIQSAQGHPIPEDRFGGPERTENQTQFQQELTAWSEGTWGFRSSRRSG